MSTTNPDSAEDALTCANCGGKIMVIHLEENDVQKVRCAGCHSLVAFTSNLVRIL